MCSKVIHRHLGSITLDLGLGEKLRHTIELTQGAAALFSIVDNVPSVAILTNADPQSASATWVRDWPLPGDVVNGDTLHGVLLQFVVAKSYAWRVQRLDGAGAVVATPVDMELSNDPGSGHCFDAVNVLFTNSGGGK